MWAAALTEPPPLIGHLGMDVHIGMMTRCAQRARSSARQSGEARRAATGARGSREQHGCRQKGENADGKLTWLFRSLFFPCPSYRSPPPILLLAGLVSGALVIWPSAPRIHSCPAEALLRIAHAMRGVPNPNPKPNPKPNRKPAP